MTKDQALQRLLDQFEPISVSLDSAGWAFDPHEQGYANAIDNFRVAINDLMGEAVKYGK